MHLQIVPLVICGYISVRRACKCMVMLLGPDVHTCACVREYIYIYVYHTVQMITFAGSRNINNKK